MNSMVDSLFDQYDRGRMTRRHLVQALAAVILPTSTLAQERARASGPIVRGLSVNHVSLTVSDVPRSFAFYERLFGVTKGWPATDAGYPYGPARRVHQHRFRGRTEGRDRTFRSGCRSYGSERCQTPR